MDPESDHLAVWKSVLRNQVLLEAVRHCDATDVREITALRKQWSQQEIAVAIELTSARMNAQGKLDHPELLVSDLEGVQQCSSSAMAKWKSRRFADKDHVVDLCCGIGGDLRYLPKHAVGVDVSQLRCWMSRQNTNNEVVCEDARQCKGLKTAHILIDPARRDRHGRRLGLSDMKPSIQDVETICKESLGGCVKLSPAIDLEDVSNVGDSREVEYIEENGRVRQGLVWFDTLARDFQVTATSVSLNETVSGSVELPKLSKEIGGWIYEPNPALERAKLHGTVGNQLGLWELAHGLGLLSGDSCIDSPWLTAFEILGSTPLRLEKIAKALQDHRAGEVEVKTRGGVVNTDDWQRKLQTPANETNERLTVFALRLGTKRTAFVTRRVKR